MKRVGIAVVGLVSLATPAALLALICLVVLVAAELPGRTWVRRCLYAVIAVFALDAAVLTALAVVGVSCRPRVLLAVLLVVLLVRQVWHPRRGQVPLADGIDGWSLGFGALTFGVLYSPFVGASTGRTMALLSQTTDGGTHAQILTAILRHGGYVNLDPPPGLSQGAADYPAAWHGNAWIVLDLLTGHLPGVGLVVGALAALAMATYALLATLAAAVALDLLGARDRTGVRDRVVSLVVLGLVLVVGCGLFLVQLQSFTQLFALAALLAAVRVAGEPADGLARPVVVLAATSVAVMQCWYLLAPVLAVIVLLAWLQLRAGRLLWSSAVLVTAPFVVYPVLVGPGAAHADLPGPSLLPTIGGVLGLAVASAVGITWALRDRPDDVSLRAVGGGVACLLTLLALIAKQGFVPRTGVSYYGAKLLLSSLVWGSVLASAAAPALLARGRSLGALAGLVAVMGIAAGTRSTAWVTIPPRPALYEGHLSPTALEAVVEHHPYGPAPGTETWIVDGCDRVGDLVASKWLYDISLTWTDRLRDDMSAYAGTPRGDVSVLERRLQDRRTTSMELYVHQDCDPEALHRLEANPKVRVIHVA